MIVVTGAAGFIGSCLVQTLNNIGIQDLVLVDNFSSAIKNKNIAEKKYSLQVERDHFFTWAKDNQHNIQFIFHIGARTDTTELDIEILNKWNLNFSKEIWNLCTQCKIPLVYASSAATYGLGELGFQDDHKTIELLQPLNPYGVSKNEFDKWVLLQDNRPPFWAGLKFFNVYGPNEYHKGRMASVIFHTFNSIKNKGSMQLFRSHHPDFKDGEQLRDFIYVKDVCQVLLFMMNHQKDSGIYNLGSGKARSFNDLAIATFNAMVQPIDITYIDTPADIREKYQYFTQANIEKLRSIGYTANFTSLEDGVNDYVKQYLLQQLFY